MTEDDTRVENIWDTHSTYPSPEQLLITAESIFEQHRFQQILRNPTINIGGMLELLNLKEMTMTDTPNTIKDDSPVPFRKGEPALNVPDAMFNTLLEDLLNCDVMGYNCGQTVLQQFATSYVYRALGARQRTFLANARIKHDLEALAKDMGVDSVDKIDKNDPDYIEILAQSDITKAEEAWDDAAPKAAYLVQSIDPGSINLTEIRDRIITSEPTDDAVNNRMTQLAKKMPSITFATTKKFMMQANTVSKEDETTLRRDLRKASNDLRTMNVDVTNFTNEEMLIMLAKMHKRTLQWLGDKSIPEDTDDITLINRRLGQLERDNRLASNPGEWQATVALLERVQERICDYEATLQNQQKGTDTPVNVINNDGDEPVEMH